MVFSSTNLRLSILFLVSTFHFLVARKNRDNHSDLTKDIPCYLKGLEHCVPLLEQFLNTFHSVRFHGQNKQLTLKDKEWFSGRDVCQILGFKNANQALLDRVKQA